MPRLVIIADTHLRQLSLPPGDILIHCGDLTLTGSVPEVARAAMWLGGLQGYQHKVVIAGNHDWLFERDPATARLLLEEKGVTYLQDQAAEFFGLKFWGSPYSPRFMDWAFNVERGEALEEVWARIPADTNVLITHGPPRGILDGVGRLDDWAYGEYARQPLHKKTEHVGCANLRARVAQLSQLKLHAYGHIHRPGTTRLGPTTFVNASVVNENYDISYPAKVIDL